MQWNAPAFAAITGGCHARILDDSVLRNTPALGRVKADPGQIEQVIMNLAINSRDAMPKGGKLTTETANVDLDEVQSQADLALEPGRYVRLAVSDTGCGMDAETRAHLFG